MLFLCQGLLGKFLLSLLLLQKLTALFSEILLIEIELLPYKQACQGIKDNFCFKSLFFNKFFFLKNPIYCTLTISFIKPFIFTDFIVVHLLIKNILVLSRRFISFNQLIFMLDSLRTLQCNVLLLLFGKGRKQFITVIDKKSIWTCYQFSTIETIPFSFLRTYNFAASQTIINQLVFLRHAWAFDSLQVNFLGPRFFFLHLIKDYCLIRLIIIIMIKEVKNKKGVKLPLIKEKINIVNSGSINKSLKLQRINRQKHIALIDISKINKIQKEFEQITKRHIVQQQPKKDEMRESKLLLLRNLSPSPKKTSNLNMLSNLVEYNVVHDKLKTAMIPTNNISLSPTKQKKPQKKMQSVKNISSHYVHAEQLQNVDFVKMFIIQELFYYISKTNQRLKEEMAGFCKFYNENYDEDSANVIAGVLVRGKDYLHALFYQKLGFYIFLILGTDAEVQTQARFLLDSLADYLHTNNLIILDLLMQIIDIQKFSIASQFHVYNTLRFNEDRRKIRHNQDRMNLIAKNNTSISELIRSIVNNCGFQSLKTFVFQILSNEETQIVDKVREVSLMLISLDSILTNSINQTTAKPKPPFLPPAKEGVYTLVLDMDETLIHTKQIQNSKSVFLIRPYCNEFLDDMAKYFQIVIFTAAVKEYADNILDSIDQKKRISHRLYRQHTRIEDYVSIKDLSQIGRDLSRTIIIDNIASNFKQQPRNGIAISTWTGQPQDISLLNLMPVLRKLVIEGVNDVRAGLQKLSQYMQARMNKGQEIVFDQISLKGL